MKKITILLFMMLASIGFSQPTTNAPQPTHPVADVISIYGDFYTTNIATNYNPNWGQTGFGSVNPNFDPGTGNVVLAYPNFNYQGTELTATNLSSMEFLHLDIWVAAGTSRMVKVSPVNTGPGQFLVEVPLTPGSWNSVSLPKASFVGMTWNSVFQLLFDGQFNANGSANLSPFDIYLDNIYFRKTSTDPTIDASLSSLEVGGASVPGFSSATFEYTFPLLQGQAVPQITAATTTNANATTVITQATAAPGAATVVVTASNGTTTATYTVNFVVSGPTSAAPTPPARPAADVKSIFSDAYTPVSTIGYTGANDTFDTGWCPGTTTLVQIDGNNTNRVTGLGCEGIDFLAGRFDATGFTDFHIDFWTDTPTQDKSFNIKFSNWTGGAAETNAYEYSATNANILPSGAEGSWISLEIPLADFTCIAGGCPDLTDFVQFIITSDLGTVYYDNIYLHKGTTLSSNEFADVDFRVYPNPATVSWNITANSPIENVKIVNILGQQVIETTPNSKTAEINNTQLANGLYFATIKTENGYGVVKLLKN